jgi:hypothetical protein
MLSEEQGTLFAFNAATGEQLYSTNKVAGDELGAPTPNFLHFTLIAGRVFVANANNTLLRPAVIDLFQLTAVQA